LRKLVQSWNQRIKKRVAHNTLRLFVGQLFYSRGDRKA
jgi:hypothetical protein